MAGRPKMRWGEMDDDDAAGLPGTTVTGPDDKGIKTVVEYYKTDKGDAFKKTSKIKVFTVEKKVYKVEQRPQRGRGISRPESVRARAHPRLPAVALARWLGTQQARWVLPSRPIAGDGAAAQLAALWRRQARHAAGLCDGAGGRGDAL